VQIKSTVRVGSVYYFPEESFSSSEPHYFIVVNLNPIDDSVVILVWASSRISTIRQRRKNYPPTTLVEITPAQYPVFKCNSIIDCNKFMERTIDELVERLSSGKLDLKTEMPQSLTSQLRQGVLDSPRIPGRIKKMLG